MTVDPRREPETGFTSPTIRVDFHGQRSRLTRLKRTQDAAPPRAIEVAVMRLDDLRESRPAAGADSRLPLLMMRLVPSVPALQSRMSRSEPPGEFTSRRVLADHRVQVRSVPSIPLLAGEHAKEGDSTSRGGSCLMSARWMTEVGSGHFRRSPDSGPRSERGTRPSGYFRRSHGPSRLSLSRRRLAGIAVGTGSPRQERFGGTNIWHRKPLSSVP